jgi:hypothetical protein
MVAFMDVVFITASSPYLNVPLPNTFAKYDELRMGSEL